MTEKFNYEKFSEDVTDSLAFARAAALAVKDDGTCNLDSAVVLLPKGQRVDEARLPERCRKTHWMGPCIFLPGGPGQANVRCKFAEVLAAEMKNRGWNTAVYYQMD